VPRVRGTGKDRPRKNTLVAFAVAACAGSVFAADVPIPYNPNSVEYQKLSQVGQWQQLTGATPGQGGRVVFQPNTAASTVSPKVSDLRLSQAGAGVSVNGKVDLPIGGSKTIPVNVGAAITKNAFLAGLGLVVSNPLVGLGIAIAAPSIIDWLSSGRVGINTDQSDPNKPFTRVVDGEFTNLRFYFSDFGPYTTPQGACNKIAQLQNNGLSIVASGSGLDWECIRDGGVRYRLTVTQVTGDTTTVIPATVGEVQAIMGSPNSLPLTPNIVSEGVKAGVDPFGAQGPQVTASGPTSVPGEKTTTSESIRLKPGTNIPAAPGEPSEPGTKTTTSQQATNVTYNGNTVTSSTTNNTTTNITNHVTNITTNEGDKITETTSDDNVTKPEEQEIKVCGLPNTPPCKMDETGTPEAKPDTAEVDAKKALKPLDDLIANPQSALPTLPTINWAFTLPSGCAPIALPAFDPWLQEIDVCAFQPMFHDIMTFVWVLGGIFGAIGTFWRNTFSQG